jgi:hypothetical protein
MNLTVIPPAETYIQSANLVQYSMMLISSAMGAVIGGFIAYWVTTTSTKIHREYESKKQAYESFLALDTGRPLLPEDRKLLELRAKHLIDLSGNEEIKNLTKELLKIDIRDNFSKRIDEDFVPAIQKDLQATLNPKHWWQWQR